MELYHAGPPCREGIDQMNTLILFLIFFPVIMSAMVLLAASLVWVYRDAEERHKSGILVALLVLLLNWPISLLLWLVFRPEGGKATIAQ
jgi:uncharacterized membrane protein YozB (DUF420 family)